MKKGLLLLTLFIASLSFSQGMGDVTIYSNTGDKFYVVLNGVRQNKQAETNVKITGLTNQWYACKIISANNNFEIEKNLGVKFDTLITYQIKEKKGTYKLRYFSETALGTSTAVPNQTVVVYSPVDNSNNTQVANINSNTNTNGTTTTTTTTNSTTDNAGVNMNGTNGSEGVNMNVSITESGANVNMNVNATGTGQQNVTTTSSTTTTTTTTTTTSDGSYYDQSTSTTTTNNGGNVTYYEETTTTSTTNSNGNLYQDDDMIVTFDNSCYTSDQEVDVLVKQVKDESFSDDQQRVANMAAKNKCLSVAQIKRIAETFSFSENQLSFLKAAYDNCTDQGNYYQLMEVLTFSSDKEALEAFINSK